MTRLFLLVLLIIAVIVGYKGYELFAVNNINPARESQYINIPTGSGFEDVLKLLQEKNMLNDEQGLKLVARYKGYDKGVKPGRYMFARRMNNREIVNMLQAGLQSKVKLNLYNIQTKEDFAAALGKTLECDSAQIYDSLVSDAFLSRYGLNRENILTRFIYNTYELNWNTAPDKLFSEFDSAYSLFWNEERLSKARAKNLTPTQAIILASIVEKECMKESEMQTVAGVYLNRLRIGMPLQADPTLKFAAGDFDARRVTNYHKDIESPYNTYKNRGLPPGPICIPRKKSVDAVLNASRHEYLYFCASPDMSGFSVFSKTLAEQNKTAALYRKKLDLIKIR